jgi:RNA polymerase sigma-70 factor, ECF subfamily
MKNSDDKLVKKAKMGDSQAFGKLVKIYQKKVLYLAYDLVGNYYDAQDVAQNTFFQAFKNLPFFKGQSTFSTWLYRITTNAAIDFQRSKKRRQATSLNQPMSDDKEDRELIDSLKDSTQLFDKKMENLDLKELIKRETESLPPQQRAAFVLKYFHDKPTEDIAEILKCDPITVRGHILRATLKLKKQLKAEK